MKFKNARFYRQHTWQSIPAPLSGNLTKTAAKQNLKSIQKKRKKMNFVKPFTICTEWRVYSNANFESVVDYGLLHFLFAYQDSN
jgi:hypothetical protein